MKSAAVANSLFTGDAGQILSSFEDGCIDLVVTSPPYWTAVGYDGQPNPWSSYEAYLADMQRIFAACARILRPNGKLCVNAPIMPIPQAVIRQHTRHLKNITSDIEHGILANTDLARYSLFVWQKQTSKMMFGSYPNPGNILENNTIEFIHVYVKPGKPPRFPAEVKAANRLTRAEWIDLTQQVWFMYPQDVQRGGEHPAPFPDKLPARLMRLYSYGAAADFPGEIVLDPFAGTGTTCAVANRMKRRFVGIDINPDYVRIAQERLRDVDQAIPLLLVGRASYPGRERLEAMAAEEAGGTQGKAAQAKHKRKTYGRKVPVRRDDQFTLA